jgi:protein-tyrosine phosphatase
VIDIHCHILPELDDGAKSWDVALAMCRLAIQDGIEHIVATPHANENYLYSRDRVRAAISELDSKLDGRLAFSIGCDFHLSYKNIEDAIAQPRRYTIGAGQYLLVELSDYAIPPHIDESFFRLQMAGMIPVITHPERNPILQRNPERVLEWVQAGCLVQVTASALEKFWGGAALNLALCLLECGAVHVLATDAHDHTHRKPILSKARDIVLSRFGTEVARALTDNNPRAIVAGQPLPFRAQLSHQPASRRLRA